MKSARRQALSIAASLVAVIVTGTFIAVRGADGSAWSGPGQRRIRSYRWGNRDGAGAAVHRIDGEP